ncbi:MAG TPA: hypothetical protein PLO33_19440, partial [Kouleothrix sp.]|nr:hypothetical protein [Kouleothrix sp.]
SAFGRAVLYLHIVSIFRAERGKWTQKMSKYHAAAGSIPYREEAETRKCVTPIFLGQRLV